MKQLVKAVLNVMEECEGIDKSLQVGEGRMSYKGVSDKDVKLKVGQSMRKHGLIILPTEITPITQLNRWEEEQEWNGKKTIKQKQSVFTEVITKYRLIHESGEEATVAGYGHGVDSQDKSAGKATTYALKYNLLYTFLVATGHIDDTDNTHSEEIKTPTLKEVKKEMVLQLKESVLNGKTKANKEHIDKSLNKKGYKSLTDAQYKEITS